MLPGGVWTVLLVVSMTAIASTVSTPVPLTASTCHRRPINIIVDYLKCDRNYMSSIFGEGQTPTKAELLEFTGHQCTDGQVATKACFADLIKDCNSTLKAKLNDLIARGLGFLCQPEERGVEPAITYVINSMNDEDLAKTRVSPCNVSDACQNDVRMDWKDPSLDGMAQSLQSYLRSHMLCAAEMYKAARFTCPHWRADLLMSRIGPLISVPFMGTHLPFSQQEVADMFQLETNLE